MLERLLDAAVDREGQRLAAGARVRQIGIERPLHSRDAMPVDVGVTDDVGGKAGLRIKTVGLALDGEAGLSERVHGLDQSGRGAPPQIEERLARLQQDEILLLAA